MFGFIGLILFPGSAIPALLFGTRGFIGYSLLSLLLMGLGIRAGRSVCPECEFYVHHNFGIRSSPLDPRFD